MTANELAKLLEAKAAHIAELQATRQEFEKAMPLLLSLAELPGFADVTIVTVSVPQLVNLWLARVDSELPREVARKFSVRLTKKSLGTSLYCTGTIDGWRVDINNYLPPSCRLEYEEVEVPARIERRVHRIVCGEDGDE